MLRLDYGLDIYDFLLFPFYLFVVYKIFKLISLKYKDNIELSLYFKFGFWIKISMVVVFSILAQFVIGGDSLGLFYNQGTHFADIIIQDASNIDLLFTKGGTYIDGLAGDGHKGYLAMESNYIIVKISTFLCLLTFSKYLLVNLIIGFITFLGSWQLFLFFYAQYQNLRKEFAFACMGIPTVIFWSSSIGKDAICMASLGFLTKCLYDVVINGNKKFRNSIIVLIAIYLIYTIKPYIIISYFPFLSLFIVFAKINKTRNNLHRALLRISIPAIFILIGIFVVLNSKELLEQFSSEVVLDKVVGLQNAFTAQADDAGSNFSLGEFDGSIGSVVKMAPLAIGTTLFRPFIWESRNIIMLLSALEAIILLFFTLKLFFTSKGLNTFFSMYIKNALLFFCISFSIIFSLFVGLSTFNFGSLARYKIPCIPFFVCALIIVQHHAKLKRGVQN